MTVANTPTAGLVPFYIKLYDDVLPNCRGEFAGLLSRITAEFQTRGIRIIKSPVCRIACEFQEAVAQLEADGVDCIVTLHLAYSPSLESLDVFCRTKLPIVILDTTMDRDFGTTVATDRIMYNHGVHGVMDFASMLRRRQRHFEIIAGHMADERLLDGAVERVRGAFAARRFAASKVLRVGPPFQGMGDFAVSESVLASKLGMQVRQVGIEELDRSVKRVSDADIMREMNSDHERFDCELAEETHGRSVRVGLGLRRLIEEGAYEAHSVNFQIFDRPDRAADTMPFLEISKAMARGIGYAGEGDVLTAALVGALSRTFGEVTFTEIFCPDWTGDSLFLSHMGEISPAVAVGKPRVIEKPYLFGHARNPAILTCAVRPGPAVWVNIAPGPDDSFALIVSPVTVLAEGRTLGDGMKDAIRAWIRPAQGVARFLESYSRAGGTHHSSLVLGDRMEAIAAFGRFAGLSVISI